MEVKFDMYKCSFLMALNNEKLTNIIKQFDEEKYKKEAESFMNEVGIFKAGKASEWVIDLILG